MFLDLAVILNKYAGTEGGVSNLFISVDGENFYDDANSQEQRTRLKEDLMEKWDLDLDNDTLASLNEKTLICKYENNPTEYHVYIIIAQ